MTVSLNTNAGAMVALQNLNATQTTLQMVQKQINSGLKVADAMDNGGVFAIAQNMRSQVGGLAAVTDSLNNVTNVVDVANSAGTAISNILVEMKQKAVAASDTSIDTTSRKALSEDFTALRDQISTIVKNASFNGVNIIDSSTFQIAALASADAKNHITVSAANLSLGQSIVTITANLSISTQALASAAAAAVDTSLHNVNNALAKLGTSSKKLSIHSTFVSQLSDALTSGIGNLVDADLAKTSAQLQALQVKQQLGVQALSIANSAPQILLGLFR
ncbi:MAG: flagellin [Alphaproteobacteria bacterium]